MLLRMLLWLAVQPARGDLRPGRPVPDQERPPVSAGPRPRHHRPGAVPPELCHGGGYFGLRPGPEHAGHPAQSAKAIACRRPRLHSTLATPLPRRIQALPPERGCPQPQQPRLLTDVGLHLTRPFCPHLLRLGTAAHRRKLAPVCWLWTLDYISPDRFVPTCRGSKQKSTRLATTPSRT